MSSGQQYWADQQAEASRAAYQVQLAADSKRLEINVDSLEKLRKLKHLFARNIQTLPYGVASELKKLLESIPT